MASTQSSRPSRAVDPGITGDDNTGGDGRRANPAGLYLATLGVLVFALSQFLNWVEVDGPATDDGVTRTGYETDSLIPFIAFLGIGLVIALFYAMQRARRAQHRGLTLAAMATGIAATIWCIAFALEPMGGLERGDNLKVQLGVYVGLLGAALWAAGAATFAKEIEGDDNDPTDNYTLDGSRTGVR